MERYNFSIKQACKIVRLERSMYYYQRKKRDDSQVTDKLSEISEKYPKYGFGKMFWMIRNEGHLYNHKKVYRIYCQMKLNLTIKRVKRLASRHKETLSVPQKINEVWSIDFMSDKLYNNRRFRVLNIIDDFNRECLDIYPDYSIPGYMLVERLTILKEYCGLPKYIRVDNGPEFLSKEFVSFCTDNNISIKYIQPGKPMQNGFIERFNRSLRNEILDLYIFESLKQVRDIIYQWMEHYNYQRPHCALNNLPPFGFKNKFYTQLSG